MMIQEARYILTALYHLLILGVGVLGVWVGLVLDNQFVLDIFALGLLFHVVTFQRNGILPVLLRRALCRWDCACGFRIPLVARWRCPCKAITYRSCHDRCSHCKKAFSAINCPRCSLTILC